MLDKAILRKLAEEKYAETPPADRQTGSVGELLHELQVYQIELEMQNEQLRQSQLDLEKSRDSYANLYEFAPVAYLTLTPGGRITSINLTGAKLLGMERSKLIGRHFASFVSPGDVNRWRRFFRDTEPRSSELTLGRVDGSRLHVMADGLLMSEDSSLRVTLTDISERKRAEQESRKLSVHLQTVREEEKSKLARELHDGLGSTLTALKLDAHWLANKLPEAAEPVLACIDGMNEHISNAILIMRGIITELRPIMLNTAGLFATLTWQCAEFQKRSGITCSIACIQTDYCQDERVLDEALSINLYRIFQETLTNVARHSSASCVTAEYGIDRGQVTLSISDNGDGLPDGYVISTASFGLLGMRERVDQFGGDIRFDSRSGKGFTVTVTLPLTGNAKHA